MFLLENGLKPSCLQFSLEYRKHTLDWIVVWTVGRAEDVGYGHLIQPFLHMVASVDCQVVHVDADVLEEVLVA